MDCIECFRTFLRVILVVVNVFIALLGLLVFAVGIWAVAEGDSYFEISGKQGTVTQVPILLIVVGVFVLLLGVVGTVGGIFAGTIGGRIILGLYGFVLSLLVICEIAGGIAAAVEKDNLSSSFTDSINDTFSRYYTDSSVRKSWDTFQETAKCCGNKGFTDYATVLKNEDESVPRSCCNATKTADSGFCDYLRVYNSSRYIYPDGCGSKARDFIDHRLGVVAGVAITFGFLQIIGVVVSCFVAIAGRQAEGKYQVV